MLIYKIDNGEVCGFDVNRETNLYYFLLDACPAFGYSIRIKKEHACLTPQEAIKEALNGRRTMLGAFKDKLVKVESEIVNLEKLEIKYNKKD